MENTEQAGRRVFPLMVILGLMLLPVWTHAQGYMQIIPGTSIGISGNVFVVISDMDFESNGPAGVLSSGTLVFTGSGFDQRLLGASVPTYFDVIIDKPGKKLIMERNLEVDNNLTFVSGNIDVQTFQVDMRATGTVVGETNLTGFVGSSGGTVIATGRAIGTGNTDDVASLGLVITPVANDIANLTVTRGLSFETGSGKMSIRRSFDLTMDVPAGALNATLVLNYLEHEKDATHGGLDEADYVMFRSDDGGVTWFDRGGTTEFPTNRRVTLTGLTTIDGRWTLSSTTNSLPIELLSFDAQAVGKEVLVTWETALEINNNYFEIERSRDLDQWEVISRIPSVGQSSAPRAYSHSDTDPYSGISYYRLTQTDFNGDLSRFEAVQVVIGGVGSLRIYPQPNTGRFTLTADAGAEWGRLRVTDLAGRDMGVSLQVNGQTVEVSLNDPAAGWYLLHVPVNGRRVTHKFLVGR